MYNLIKIYNLRIGDFFTNAQDFEFQVLQVTKSVGGVFEGFCKLTVAWLGGTFVAGFKDLSLNTDYQMLDGEVEMIEKPLEEWLSEHGNILNTAESNADSTTALTNMEIKDTILVAGKIDTVYRTQNGEIVIVSENGETTRQVITENTLIMDDEGNRYVVDENGEISGNNNTISEVAISNSPLEQNYVKFKIHDVDYINNSAYYTIYSNDSLEISVEKIDENAVVDLTKISWQLNKIQVLPYKGKTNTIKIQTNIATLKKSENEVNVLDDKGKLLGMLKINSYHSPKVKFEEGVKGEYFFDRGFESFQTLASNGQYDTMKIGKDKEIYFAPVLGLNKDQSATIKFNLKDFEKNAKNDINFKIVIKSELPQKITINGIADSLSINANELNNIKEITIEAKNYIDDAKPDNIIPMRINVFVGSTRERIGRIEYYCARKKHKTIRLIYVKFKGEKKFPTYLNHAEFSTYLNTKSMNQLFYDAHLDTIHFTSNTYKVSDMELLNNNVILQNLNLEFYKISPPPGFDMNNDYFYITNIDKQGKGGFHITGDPGGVQLLYRQPITKETAIELSAHEIGHWFGLTHTFETNRLIPFIIDPKQGGTFSNFMDYYIIRKDWFKIQLIKCKR